MDVAELDTRMRIVEQQINTHEAVCAERYAGILKTSNEMKSDVQSLNKLLVKIGLTLLGGMLAILAKLVFFQ
jgi:hypothetical protein